MAAIIRARSFGFICGDPATPVDKHSMRITREAASSTLRDATANPHLNPTTPEAPR